MEGAGSPGVELLADETLRCLVVTGEGPTFSAGIDLVEGLAGLLVDGAKVTLDDEPTTDDDTIDDDTTDDDTIDDDTLAVGLALAGTFNWIPEIGCASVAAVRGHAYGAGLQLALAVTSAFSPRAPMSA